MSIKNILKMALAAGLLSGVIATIAAGNSSYVIDPNDPFYKGSLCIHRPSGR
ncbi:MAG: hypothetical protein GY927_18880 [bacterium]|nr:hypothetical protein [bacterium]